MSALAELPPVTDCAVTGCGFNHDHDCHAAAVTIAGQRGDAACVTFIPLGTKGGLDTVLAHVGACQRTDCVHNADLECSATEIRVGAGGSEADCLTYTARA